MKSAAAANGSVSIVKQLLVHGAHINVQGGSYGNHLRAAIYCGRNEVIDLLLDNGADVGLLPPHLLVDINYTISRAIAQRLFSAGIQSLRRNRFHQQQPLKSAVEGEGLIQEDIPDPTLALDDFDMFRHANGLDGDRGKRRLQPYH
ncbi:hypothetical protein HII31_06427 [Pseudocercospora fuligena]|uniref:Ankyrin repeat protein n=1 Tax=Pseudocercospora fuligena TaxID=685502 RepID=A0A8H6VMQ8_9PEZI|nr:hypothetical protein HII31_06427 [Pseudocercospora fuligena]